MKEKDLKFIKSFAEISISELCRELVIDRSNLYRGLVKEEKIHELRELLEKKLKKLLESKEV
jgi:hypothetical protein